MILRRLTSVDRELYDSTLLRGVREDQDCFRITEADVLAAPTPLNDRDPDAFTLGAGENEHHLMGVVSIAREKGEKMRHKALLYRMYVAPEYAGKGMGYSLLAEAVRLAGGMPGLEQIQLTVLANNSRAKRLYQRLGFCVFALEKSAIRWGDKAFDEERMVLHLPCA